MAPSGASPELRRETHRESGAAAVHRAPRAYRAPRIKKQPAGFPAGCSNGSGLERYLRPLPLPDWLDFALDLSFDLSLAAAFASSRSALAVSTWCLTFSTSVAVVSVDSAAFVMSRSALRASSTTACMSLIAWSTMSLYFESRPLVSNVRAPSVVSAGAVASRGPVTLFVVVVVVVVVVGVVVVVVVGVVLSSAPTTKIVRAHV